MGVLKWEDLGRPNHPKRPIRTFRFRKQKYVAVVFIAPGQERKCARAIAKGFELNPLPASPRPDLWEQLRRAQSSAELRKMPAGDWKYEMVLRFADGLIKAKGLPTYPGSDRHGSDNKRVKFFAKVLAGLELGISPTTAIKYLSNSALPEESIVARDLREFWGPLVDSH